MNILCNKAAVRTSLMRPANIVTLCVIRSPGSQAQCTEYICEHNEEENSLKALLYRSYRTTSEERKTPPMHGLASLGLKYNAAMLQ